MSSTTHMKLCMMHLEIEVILPLDIGTPPIILWEIYLSVWHTLRIRARRGFTRGLEGQIKYIGDYVADISYDRR